jgi:peptidoglycan/LPS O-acetylase OafA/YrhL
VKTISHQLPFIDLVRGVSSILVVISHGMLVEGWNRRQGPSFLGAVAVDFFIIISGFLMTWTLGKGRDGFPGIQDRGRILSFYIRRFFRITPLFYTAFFVSLWFMPRSFDFILMYLTYLYGLFTYYSELTSNPPLWSITLEMQFYVVTPFIFIACRFVRPALLFFGCAVLSSISNCLWGWGDYPGLLGEFIHPTFLPLCLNLFVIGILLGLHYLKSTHAPSLRVSLALMALTPLVCPRLFHIIFCTVLGAMALILLLLRQGEGPPFIRWIKKLKDQFLDRITGNRLIKLLADYSFGLYVFHSFVLKGLGPIFAVQPWFHALALPWQTLFVTVSTLILTYLIVMVTFNLIEKPGVWLGRKIIDSYVRAPAC